MKLIQGDCLDAMKALEDNSVDCCITSPPYFGLRDYGVEGQLGLEKTPQEYVDKMVLVFREVRRILKETGTLWLNLGDCYNSGRNGGHAGGGKQGKRSEAYMQKRSGANVQGLKVKDLIGIPWRVAFALQADGWYLRQDIIWHKPNPMPESIKDRCTKSHEYIFLLSKSSKYHFDSRAICEPMKLSSIERQKTGWNGDRLRGLPSANKKHNMSHYGKPSSGLRNKRSVWTITTKSFKGAHFATFPQDLVEPCLLAGCPKDGIVIDPFFGAGTVGVVAKKHERKWIGIELNHAYCEIAEKRIGA